MAEAVVAAAEAVVVVVVAVAILTCLYEVSESLQHDDVPVSSTKDPGLPQCSARRHALSLRKFPTLGFRRRS